MILVQLWGFVLLHAIPKSILRRRLCRRLSLNGYSFEPFFSGRVSLFVLACRLALRADSKVALVPDYVCNIVARAFTLAGWRVLAYPTGQDLEPQWEELLSLVDAHRAGVVVGASVFGSSALLSFLGDADKRSMLRERSVQVVVDLAQDVRLAALLPSEPGQWIHGVLSFNDKSFPGAMGGGILSMARAVPEPMQRLSMVQLFRLYMRLSKNLASNLLVWLRALPRAPSAAIGAPKPGLDYSTCDFFPYEVKGSCYEPAKLQYVMALLGFATLDYYGRRKSALLERGIHLPTRFASTAAYVIAAPGLQTSPGLAAGPRARKRPYALENRPTEGLRNDDIILHNKGFFDRR